MRIGIIGSGSIGSLVAGCLASTDSDLLLYGRGLHAAELMVNGLTVSGVKEKKISGDRWEVIPSEQPLPSSIHSSCDVVIFTGKPSTDREFLEVGGHILKPGGISFSLSNGMGFEEKMVHAFGAQRQLMVPTGQNLATLNGLGKENSYLDHLSINIPLKILNRSCRL